MMLTNEGQGNREVIRHSSADLGRLLDDFVELRELCPLILFAILVHLLLWGSTPIFFVLY